MINVLFEAHFLKRPNSGNGRYTRALLDAMIARGRSSSCFVIAYGPALDSSEQTPENYVMVGSGRLGRVLWSPEILSRRFDARVHHAQYTTPLSGGKVKKCVTIHDAAFSMRRLSDYSRAKTIAFKYFAQRSDAIITVSRSAKLDLEKLLPASAPPIHVIYNGCSLSSHNDEDEAFLRELLAGYHRPYILYIGRMSKRKRVPLLIEAFGLFKRKHEGTLILLGEPDDDVDRVGSLVRHRKDIKWVRGASESTKAALLSRSDAFVYLSEYEGFGLPVAEAMLARVPVVITKTPALQEVSQGTAIEVDATPPSVAQGIAEAVFGMPQRTLEDAHEVATRYNWGEAGEQTIAVYKDLAAL